MDVSGIAMTADMAALLLQPDRTSGKESEGAMSSVMKEQTESWRKSDGVSSLCGSVKLGAWRL
jgi:hypothetical protein